MSVVLVLVASAATCANTWGGIDPPPPRVLTGNATWMALVRAMARDGKLHARLIAALGALKIAADGEVCFTFIMLFSFTHIHREILS